MRKTRLFIKVNNKWEEVELFEDIIIPVTLKVMDINTFGQKSSSYTSDIEIPHTSHNSQVFGLVEELNTYNATFEFCKNYEAYLEVDGLVTFRGQFRLKKIFKQRGGDYSYYVGCLFSDSKNFIDKLGTETLIGNEDPNADLSFSDYYTPSSEMQLSNFVERLQTMSTGADDWGLTLIDKTNKAETSFSSGRQQWTTEECTPYLYVMDILNKIFAKAGYEYTSEFLMGDGSNYLTQDPRWAETLGKYNVYQMIYPYTKNNSNLKTINPSSCIVSQNDTTANTDLVSGDVWSYYDFDVFYLLNGSNYEYTVNFDTSLYSIQNSGGSSSTLNNWRFVAPERGIYNINISIPFYIRMRMYNNHSSSYYSGTVENDKGNSYDWQVRIMKNGSTISTAYGGDKYPETYTVNSDGYVYLSDLQNISYNGSLSLNEGDSIQIYCYVGLGLHRSQWNEMQQAYVIYYAFWTNELLPHTLFPRNLSVHVPYNADLNQLITIEQMDGFYEGNDFDPTSIINEKTTKLDFFTDIMKMFNLYVEDVSGKMNYKTGQYYRPNTIRVEPYEIYYNPDIQYGSNIHDWTDKIDWKSVEYRRIDDYLYNIQRFTFSNTKDYYLDDYNNTYRTPYGQFDKKGVYCTSNKNVNEIKLSTCVPICGVVNSQTDTLQCPKLFSLTNKGVVDVKKEYPDTFLFLWKNNMSQKTTTGTNYTLRVKSTNSSSYTDITSYYCADTLDKGYGEDKANLIWTSPDALLQNTNGNNPTTNHLYNAFYSKQYNAMTANDSRIMVAEAYLTPLDIATTQLSDTIIIGDNKWHILEVKEWKNEKEPCEVQLIKIVPDEIPTINSKVIPIKPLTQIDPIEVIVQE